MAEDQSRAGEVALEIRNLSKTFEGTVALAGVDVSFRAGEVHALMGHNGSGKSTLIKVLAGVHAPDPRAEATVRGVSINLGDSTAARRAGFRFVHQDLGLVESLDSVDNLALGAGYQTAPGFRIQWRRQRALVREAITEVGHSFDVRKPVSQLTALERSTLAIARALRDIGDVSVLALDEPTAAMPRPDVDRLHELVRKACNRGIAVLYVSHHIDEVLALSDQVTVLREGRVVDSRSVTEWTPRALIDSMTGGLGDHDLQGSESARPEGPVVLQVRGLSGQDLHELDLTVREGEIVGVAGLDGSGRDELCGAIFGRCDRSGEVAVAGQLLPPNRPDRAVKQGIGYVPASRITEGLIMSMTVKENLTLPNLAPVRRGLHIRNRRERGEVEGWKGRLGIRTPSIDSELHALSGGNQQKVVMARWLRLAPKLLLLDEPTQGVDVGAKAELHTQIVQAAGAGAGVVVCSSDEEELERLCDRVIVLRDGRAAASFNRPNAAATAIARECLITAHHTEGSA